MQISKTMRFMIGAAVAISAVVMPGCSKPSSGGADSNFITIKGSDTMNHLVAGWAEAYMAQHPDSNISVTGGGSGTGIAALLNQTTDLCMASREVKEEELKLASDKGIELTEHAVALDGIAVVVHPENPINELTVEQISKIFTGEYANWQDVGGPDMPIVVLSRESSSGTYVFFREHVMSDQDYSPDARLLAATSAIVQQVGADLGTIGYVGLGYAENAGEKIKALGVIGENGQPAVEPTSEAVKSGEYTIARPLYFYQPSGSPVLVSDFLEFCLSEAGQEIVAEEGYVKVS